jgi:hypothetical protein
MVATPPSSRPSEGRRFETISVRKPLDLRGAPTARRLLRQDDVTFEEAVRVSRDHVNRKFPKTCGMCARVFSTLPDYIRGTRHVGQPVSYDAALDDWRPKEPLGTYAMARCACGTSMSIDSSGMSLVTLWRLMRLARKECRRTGGTVSEFLARMRTEIERQALAEGEEGGERRPSDGERG